MLRRIIQICCLLLLANSALLPAIASNYSSELGHRQRALVDFPTVDPVYIYNQLFYMVTHFQHREAGYDNNLPVDINGHDEFAAYWSQEMMHDLAGFGAQVRRDEFATKGWLGRPTVVPAFNVEVTVPGVAHPEQAVVIGCHYDGEAVSTQSANDDGSGCAIELGIAKAMGEYWRSHNVYPARTLRFVIFDAEEQGLIGSFHYVNNTVNGDLHNIVAMFNEEQNGIAYPLRFLGKASNPLLPFYIDMSPLQNNQLYPRQDQLSQQQKNNISHFRALMQQAVIASFKQFQALGFQMLTYHGDTAHDVSQPIFTADDTSYIQQEDDALGGSDQIPFTLAGLPCATLVGNSTYYQRDPAPPPWSYPYDQAQDTIQLMNTFANGSSQKAEALTLALALPGMLTTWMLNQPDILGQAPTPLKPIATISDIGQTLINQSIALDARASFDPGGKALTYTWDFGDGGTANGISVNHTYTTAGNYTLTLAVSSPKGSLTIQKSINVVTKATTYDNPYAQYQPTGYPRPNPLVVLPTPSDSQAGGVTKPITTITVGNTSVAVPLFVVVGIVVVVVVVFMVGVFIVVRRRKPQV